MRKAGEEGAGIRGGLGDFKEGDPEMLPRRGKEEGEGATSQGLKDGTSSIRLSEPSAVVSETLQWGWVGAGMEVCVPGVGAQANKITPGHRWMG